MTKITANVSKVWTICRGQPARLPVEYLGTFREADGFCRDDLDDAIEQLKQNLKDVDVYLRESDEIFFTY